MRIAFTIDGPEAAPVLVLSHSLGVSGAMWEPQLAALRTRFRVLRYDHRGHGASEVPPGPYAIADLGRDVVALLDDAGVERAHFCGLSLGGMVGMWVAAHAPERVDRLVLACTTAHADPAAGWDERAAVARSSGVEALADAIVERWFTPAFRATAPDRIEWIRALLHATRGEGYAACCEAIRDLDLRPVLGAIVAPTLVIGAEHDPATPPERGAEIAAAIPGARRVVIPNASHLASLEQPEAFTRLLLEHFL